MDSFHFGLALFFLVGPLLSATLLFGLRERGIRLFDPVLKLLRRPLSEVLVVLFCVGGLVHLGSTKVFLGSPSPSAPAGGLLSIPAEPPAGGDAPLEAGTGDERLHIARISRGATNDFTEITVAWGETRRPVDDLVYVFGSRSLDTLFPLFSSSVAGFQSNALFRVYDAEMPTNGPVSRGFYSAGDGNDTDGDGLPNIFEVRRYGTDPADADTDGDGLPDGREVELGTNPLSEHSDGDGLTDMQELGGICADAAFQWYDTAGATNLLVGGRADVDDETWTVDLRYPVTVAGVEYTRLVIDVNGIVYLVPTGAGADIYSEYYNRDLSGWHPGEGRVAIAAYWDDLMADTSRNAELRVADIASNRCTVVEFRNVGLYRDEDALMTFQVVLPGGTGSVVRVNYLSNSPEMTGASASVGVVSGETCDFGESGRCYSLPWAFDREGGIVAPMSLVFVIGTGTDPVADDTDGDGLRDDDECFIHGTNPTRLDTDGDGLPDGWEVDNGLDPADAGGDNGAAGDPDHDGLTNINEYQNDCAPREADTDGDGVDDGTEVGQGSDPTDQADGGTAPQQDEFRMLTFNIYGDYAAWEMTIKGLGPEDTRVRRISMGAPDAARNVPLKMRKGNSYRLSMWWLNCNGHDDDDSPWYCWQAQIDGLPNIRTFPDYSNVRRIGGEIVAGDGWIAENGDGLLTRHIHQNTGNGCGNVAGSLFAMLYVLKPSVWISSNRMSNWNELDEGNVILSDEILRIVIRIEPQVPSFEVVKQALGDTYKIYTDSCPNGFNFNFSSRDELVQVNGASEIHIEKSRSELIENGLLTDGLDDAILEKASLDTGSDNPKAESNLSDSQAFDSFPGLSRKNATVSGNMNGKPPRSRASKDFFKAAGVEYISVEYAKTTSRTRQIMNQSDYFYSSGHGTHVDGAINCSSGESIGPSEIGTFWEDDLECVIFAGCSILDINDYNNNYAGTEHTKSPGKQWEQKGPTYFLGYNYIAPRDLGGAPKRIVSEWIANRGTGNDINAWMSANKNNHAWHACAIEKDVAYHYFRKCGFHRYKLIVVPKGGW